MSFFRAELCPSSRRSQTLGSQSVTGAAVLDYIGPFDFRQGWEPWRRIQTFPLISPHSSLPGPPGPRQVPL